MLCYHGGKFHRLFHLGQRPEHALSRVEIAAPQHLQRLVARHPSIIWQTAHLGCWDVGAAFLAAVNGPVQVYAKPQHNLEVDKQINIMRERLGFSVLLAADGDRRGAVKAVRGLRQGVSLGLLADQGPPPADGQGAWFLGQAVSCHTGPAFFSKQSGLPVVSGVMVRIGSGYFRFYHSAPIQDDGAELNHYLQVLLDRLSALITAVPGQYFWHHRRFKYAMDAVTQSKPSKLWRNTQVLSLPLINIRP